MTRSVAGAAFSGGSFDAVSVAGETGPHSCSFLRGNPAVAQRARVSRRAGSRRPRGGDPVEMMTKKKTNALTIRLAGRDVQLTCACGFTFVQPLRAAIEPACPKCRRAWRR